VFVKSNIGLQTDPLSFSIFPFIKVYRMIPMCAWSFSSLFLSPNRDVCDRERKKVVIVLVKS
jgi:hypothetical protein